LTISFPRGDIMSFCTWRDGSKLTLGVRKEFSRQAGGRSIGKLMGPTLWRCALTSVRMPIDDAMVLETRLRQIEEQDGTFLAYDPRRPRPASYPSGSLDGVTIYAIGSNMRSLRLQGVPAGFVLSEKDYLSFTYGDQRAVHQVAETVTASPAGITPVFEVVPHIRDGAAVGNGVRLINAYGIFAIDPDTVAAAVSQEDTLVASVSFTGTQVIF